MKELYTDHEFTSACSEMTSGYLPALFFNEEGKLKEEFIEKLRYERQLAAERLNSFYDFLEIPEDVRPDIDNRLRRQYLVNLPVASNDLHQSAQTIGELGLVLGFFIPKGRYTTSYWDSKLAESIIAEYVSTPILREFYFQANPLIAAFIVITQSAVTLLQQKPIDPVLVESERMFKNVVWANRNRINRWDWRNFHSTCLTKSTTCRVVRNTGKCYGWSMYYNYDAVRRITDANIDLAELHFRYKKAFVLDIEEVSQDEIDAAAKKMKFKGDTSTTKVYRIVNGFALKNSSAMDYHMWNRHGSDISEVIEDYEIDLEGYYLSVLRTPTSFMQSITTSIGRSLSSTNRQVVKGVMDSFELSF